MTLKTWTPKRDNTERETAKKNLATARRICNGLTAAIISGDKKERAKWQQRHVEYYGYQKEI